MLRLFVIAFATCLASLGGVFGATILKSRVAPADGAGKTEAYASAKTRMITVPLLERNEVRAYIVTRFEFVAKEEFLKSKGLPAESLVADEAFKVIYGQAVSNYRRMEKHDVVSITRDIIDGVNKRVGDAVIREALVDSWAYIDKTPSGKSQ